MTQPAATPTAQTPLVETTQDRMYGTCMACTQGVRLEGKKPSPSTMGLVTKKHSVKVPYGPRALVTVVCPGSGGQYAEQLGVDYDWHPHMRQWVPVQKQEDGE